MTLAINGSPQLQVVQREAWFLMIENIDAAIAEFNTIGKAADDEMSDRLEALGLPRLSTVELEVVEKENIHSGHRPSLIQAPIDQYPNISVMADRADPNAESASQDHLSIYTDRLRVEVMVKSNTEAEIESRIHRMTAAVNAIVLGNRSLNGKVQEIGDTPRVFLTDVFPRKEKTSYGPQWWWQGARIDYGVVKEATLHMSTNGAFLSGAYAIDQS